ncbi:MAG: hypothetical protein U9N86_09150 [Bacteroidota bacterium]|nr:hypothetical protein [Bacteroidota bacterium]
MKSLVLITLLFIGIQVQAQLDQSNMTIEVDQLQLSFRTDTRTFEIHDKYVGPEKYINTCWGLPIEGIDIVFVSNGYTIENAVVSGGRAEILEGNDWISIVRIIPEGKKIAWKLVFSKANKKTKPFVLKPALMKPSPVNIAVQARATASSVYFWGDQNGYGRPEGANDGRTFRAWEAKEGETSGWLELIWDKPVTFQKIVIDEWLESEGSIMQWELWAGHKKAEHIPRREKEAIVTYNPGQESMTVIKKGQTIGRNFVIELEQEITVNALRLNIIKSSKRPGVWELEVY